MKTIIYILIFFLSASVFGQEGKYSKELIFLNGIEKHLLLIRSENQQIIYKGVFAGSVNVIPIGTHYYFDKKGKIKRLIEYSFNGKKFEGVPEVVQRTYFFDKNQKLEKVMKAERCNECEYLPTGIWEFYKNDKLVKTIDANKVPNLTHEKYEIYLDLLKKTKQQATKKAMPIFTTIAEFNSSDIDSVKIYKLARVSMEEYKKTTKSHQLSRTEVKDLINFLKDSTNFHGGTALMFGFSSEIEFYAKDKKNTIKIAPYTKKIWQENFEIPHNAIQKDKSTGAVYWPFIKDEFAEFLTQLENKMKTTIAAISIKEFEKTQEFIEISDILSSQEFENIKNFILKKGNRQTYRNFDNNNPVYSFKNNDTIAFRTFLNAEIGQGNINNDPKISDFNQITIWNNSDSITPHITYYNILIVRKGDIKNELIQVKKGMQENRVYLVNHHEHAKDFDSMPANLKYFLTEIRNEMNAE